MGVLAESLGMNMRSAVLQVLYLGVNYIRSIPVTYNMSFTTSYGTHHVSKCYASWCKLVQVFLTTQLESDNWRKEPRPGA